MAIKPVVRYMILCDDWELDELNNRRLSISGLISTIYAHADPPYPVFHPQMCVLLVLTEGRGQGEGKILVVFEETGERIIETRGRPIVFGSDPLEVIGVPIRIRDCLFQRPGIYSVQFWYEGELVEERPLRLR